MLAFSNKFIRGRKKFVLIQSKEYSSINISFPSIARLISNRLAKSRFLISNIHTSSSLNEDNEKINEEREYLLFPYRSSPPLNNRIHGRDPQHSYLDVDFLIGSRRAFQTMLSSIFYNKINHSVEEIKKFQTLSDKLSSKFIINTESNSKKLKEIKEQTIIEKINESKEEMKKILEEEEINVKNDIKTNRINSKLKENNNDNNNSNMDKIDETMIKERDVLLKDYLFLDSDLSIFEENLEKFYRNSLIELKKSNNIMHYNCYNIGDPSLVNIDLLFGSKRHLWDKDDNFCRVNGVFGMFGTSALSKKNLTFDMNDNKSNTAFLNLMKMRQYITVRLTVDISVTEVFYIKDKITGEILQGEEEERINNHQIIFETCIDAKKTDDFEWKIADIDGFLSGNQFWLHKVSNENDKAISESK